uniref:Apolipophorin III n=1 Tax=Samia ricini TaxID=63990 RepID=A0A3G2VQQ4_SAMRI|nr:apolipophorin III [Samia ricini]
MAAKCFVLFACVALAHGAMVRRDAPNTILQDLEKHAQDFQKTISEQFNAIVNSKNTESLNKALKEGSDSMVQQVSELSNSLQGALTDANGKAKEVLQQARQNLERTVEDLRKAHPDVEKQATALHEKLQTAIQNTLKESQNLAKEVGVNMDQTSQKLAPKLKAAYDDFVKHAEEVQKKVHEAATKQ